MLREIECSNDLACLFTARFLSFSSRACRKTCSLSQQIPSLCHPLCIGGINSKKQFRKSRDGEFRSKGVVQRITHINKFLLLYIYREIFAYNISYAKRKSIYI